MHSAFPSPGRPPRSLTIEQLTRKDIIETIALEADIGKAAASRVLGIIIGTVKRRLRLGGKLRINHFGVFSTITTSARSGRNPHSGAAIKIKSKRKPIFKASETLRLLIEQ